MPGRAAGRVGPHVGLGRTPPTGLPVLPGARGYLMRGPSFYHSLRRGKAVQFSAFRCGGISESWFLSLSESGRGFLSSAHFLSARPQCQPQVVAPPSRRPSVRPFVHPSVRPSLGANLCPCLPPSLSLPPTTTAGCAATTFSAATRAGGREGGRAAAGRLRAATRRRGASHAGWADGNLKWGALKGGARGVGWVRIRRLHPLSTSAPFASPAGLRVRALTARENNAWQRAPCLRARTEGRAAGCRGGRQGWQGRRGAGGAGRQKLAPQAGARGAAKKSGALIVNLKISFLLAGVELD
jgi:hypothetical protein